MRPVLLVCIAALALPAAGQAQDLPTAHRFVAGLYARYGKGEPDYLGRDAAQAFAPDLLRLIRRDQRRAGAGSSGALDWDPICACQDPDGLKLASLNLTSTGRGTARANARLQYPSGKPIVVRLDLAFAAGHWRISDIHEAEAASLRGLLAR